MAVHAKESKVYETRMRKATGKNRASPKSEIFSKIDPSNILPSKTRRGAGVSVVAAQRSPSSELHDEPAPSSPVLSSPALSTISSPLSPAPTSPSSPEIDMAIDQRIEPQESLPVFNDEWLQDLPVSIQQDSTNWLEVASQPAQAARTRSPFPAVFIPDCLAFDPLGYDPYASNALQLYPLSFPLFDWTPLIAPQPRPKPTIFNCLIHDEASRNFVPPPPLVLPEDSNEDYPEALALLSDEELEMSKPARSKEEKKRRTARKRFERAQWKLKTGGRLSAAERRALVEVMGW